MKPTRYRERSLRFGSGAHLFGILTEPVENACSTTILIPNTGVEHHVGPNRLHVELARQFAEHGLRSLRMDLSGMGESQLGAANTASGSVDDQQAALDALQAQGLGEQFVVIGLCSGGNDAHLLSRVDRRVRGAAFIDHYIYPTARYRRRYLCQRLNLRRIGNFLRRKLAPDAERQATADSGDIDYYRQPDRTTFASELDEFMHRDLALFFLYTGELQNLYNYRDQLTDAFPALRNYPRLALHYAEAMDHTFSRPQTRSQLGEWLLAWLRHNQLSTAADWPRQTDQART